MNNLRVAFLIETFLPLVGGAEKQALRQAIFLRQQGLQPVIITLRHDQSWPAHETMDGVPIVRVAGSVLVWRGQIPRSWRSFNRLLAYIVLGWYLWRVRAIYDIVHVFQVTLFLLPALFVCRLSDQPLVVAMRSDPPAREVRQSWPVSEQYVRADLEPLERLGKPFMWLLARQLRLIKAHMVVLTASMQQILSVAG